MLHFYCWCTTMWHHSRWHLSGSCMATTCVNLVLPWAIICFVWRLQTRRSWAVCVDSIIRIWPPNHNLRLQWHGLVQSASTSRPIDTLCSTAPYAWTVLCFSVRCMVVSTEARYICFTATQLGSTVTPAVLVFANPSSRRDFKHFLLRKCLGKPKFC